MNHLSSQCCTFCTKMIAEDGLPSNQVRQDHEILGRLASEYSPAQLANIMASDHIAQSRLDEFGPLIFREFAVRLETEDLPASIVRDLFRFFNQRQTAAEAFPNPDASPRTLSAIEAGKILVTPCKSLQKLIADRLRSLADALEQGTAGSATRYSIFSDKLALAFVGK